MTDATKMTSSPSVLVAYHFFPHYRQRIIECLLDREDVCFSFAADTRSDVLDPSIRTFIPSRRFHRLNNWMIGRLYWQLGMLRSIRACTPQTIILLSDMKNLSSWFWVVVGRLLGKRTVFWSHGFIDSGEPKHKRWLRRIYLGLANDVMVYSRRARLLGADAGLDARRSWVIFNCLDHEHLSQSRLSIKQEHCDELMRTCFPGGQHRNGVIVSIARLTPIKQFDLLIQAVGRIAPASRPVIVLIGDGKQRGALQQLASELGVVVYFEGECYDERRIGTFLMSAVCAVYPGNVGLSAIHSMSYGIPVITHDDLDRQMPESEAIIEGVTGKLFKQGQVDSLVASIISMTDQINRSRSKIQSDCLRMVERFFTPNEQANRIVRCVLGESNDEPLVGMITELEIEP